MNAQISGERLTTLFRPRSVALGDDLDSLEINPLRVDGAAIEALDAVVTWAGKDNG
jgi:succinyl-CoA synthetase beta subunit